MITRFLILLLFASSLSAIQAEDVPKAFEGLFIKDQPVKAQLGMVIPPAELDKYVAKVAAAARKNQEWFEEFSSKSKPGVPLPYDEKLGLTKEEYADYIKLWNQREFKTIEEVMLLLRESSDKSWILTATGSASTLATLRYFPATDNFRSPNGKLVRIEDIDAPAESILGAWKAREWRFSEETLLGQTKENIAIGHSADGKYGMVIYHAQELTDTGTRLLDKSLVIRFPAKIKVK